MDNKDTKSDVRMRVPYSACTCIDPRISVHTQEFHVSFPLDYPSLLSFLIRSWTRCLDSKSLMGGCNR